MVWPAKVSHATVSDVVRSKLMSTVEKDLLHDKDIFDSPKRSRTILWISEDSYIPANYFTANCVADETKFWKAIYSFFFGGSICPKIPGTKVWYEVSTLVKMYFILVNKPWPFEFLVSKIKNVFPKNLFVSWKKMKDNSQ